MLRNKMLYVLKALDVYHIIELPLQKKMETLSWKAELSF